MTTTACLEGDFATLPPPLFVAGAGSVGVVLALVPAYVGCISEGTINLGPLATSMVGSDLIWVSMALAWRPI